MTHIYILSNGCHESFIDAAVLQQYFSKEQRFAPARDLESADVIVLLGCSSMQQKEDDTRELIRTIEGRKRPGAKLVMAGCISKVRPELASSDGESLRLSEEVNDLLAMKNSCDEISAHLPYRPYRDGDEDFAAAVKLRRREQTLRAYLAHAWRQGGFIARGIAAPAARFLSSYETFVQKRIDVWDEKTYAIKISTGCHGACSFCSIKQARGATRSRPGGQIVEDFQQGLAQGYRDFALIGTDIGDYGRDLGENLLALLERLLNLDGQFKIRLRNVNPRWLIPAAPHLRDLLASGKISYIQSPVQSCSERVLKLMNRGYGAAEFMDAIRTIRSGSANVFLKTQIIVGFPGETEEDFRANMRLYEAKLFNYVEVFAYSLRPHTRAAELPGQLPREVVMARRRKLLLKSLFGLAPRQLLRGWLP
jgi:threonylcarbamoyladenosine tRNA methylthiotransferase MtaB